MRYFMTKLQKIFLIFISCVIIFMFTACSKNSISVYNCNTEIKYGIESFINNEYKIKLISSRYVDNTKIVSFSTSSQYLGYAILEKKSEAIFKISSVFFCTTPNKQKIFKTHKGKYSLNIGSKNKIDVTFIEEATK